MPLSPDDAQQLLEALRSSLRAAGYANAADQVVRVSNEPLHPDELDDAPEAAELAWSGPGRLHNAEDEGNDRDDEMLTDPTPAQRLSAAIKIVDLMVVEPLRVERQVPIILRRAGMTGAEIRIGEGEAQILLPAQQADPSAAALRAWTEVLSDLREMLGAEADDR